MDKSHCSPAIPKLPMTADHVMRILDSRKTTTLRTKRISGRHDLCIDGMYVARAEITSVCEIVWPVDLNVRARLVASEGYPGDEAGFRDALCRLLNRRGHTTGTDFLTGARKLWLHRIKVVER